MLDKDRVFDHFLTMTGLGRGEAAVYRPFCDAAAAFIRSRLKGGIDFGRNMDRLCIAAAAVAYSDWLELGGSLSSAEEIRVGEITVRQRTGRSAQRGEALRERLIGDIADLLAPLPVLTVIREKEL